MTPETQTKSQKLVRCVCGDVFDSAEKKKCPGCGKVLTAAVKKPSPSRGKSAAAASADVPAALPVHRPTIPAWKWAAGALTVLAVLFCAQQIQSALGRQGKKTDLPGAAAPQKNTKPKAAAPVPPAAVIQPEKKSPFPPEGTVKPMDYPQQPTQPPVPERSSEVNDPGLVGAWGNVIRAANGQQRWALEVTADGRYSFAVSGAGLDVSHVGVFESSGGRWKMKAQNSNWRDEGTYAMINANQFSMTGRSGTWTWYREGRQPSTRGNVTQAMQEEFDRLKNGQAPSNEAVQNVVNTFKTLMNNRSTGAVKR